MITYKILLFYGKTIVYKNVSKKKKRTRKKCTIAIFIKLAHNDHFLLVATPLGSPHPHCSRVHLYGTGDGMSLLSLGYKRRCDFCLGPWICLVDHLQRQAAMLWAALWRGQHGEEVLSPGNSQGRTEGCQQPCEWTWKQILFSQLSLLMMTAPWPSAWFQHHEKIWARITQANHFWISDLQKLWAKICLLT